MVSRSMGLRHIKVRFILNTFGIKMYTEKEVYPVGTESVSVRIANRSGRTITMRTWYGVLRKEEGRSLI